MRRGGQQDDAIEAAMQAAIAGAPLDRTALESIPALGGRDILSDGFDAWEARRRVRDWFIDQYGFAVPCREAIDAIAEHGPILEVGAGTGYWSRILSHRTSVITTDIAAGENTYGHRVGAWHPVQTAAAAEAVKAHPGRAVLMVWPCYDEPWAAEAAEAMTPGSVLCYVGEGFCGCTGDERFHDLLANGFTEIAEVSIPQFDGIRDYLQVARKR